MVLIANQHQLHGKDIDSYCDDETYRYVNNYAHYVSHVIGFSPLNRIHCKHGFGIRVPDLFNAAHQRGWWDTTHRGHHVPCLVYITVESAYDSKTNTLKQGASYTSMTSFEHGGIYLSDQTIYNHSGVGDRKVQGWTFDYFRRIYDQRLKREPHHGRTIMLYSSLPPKNIEPAIFLGTTVVG